MGEAKKSNANAQQRGSQFSASDGKTTGGGAIKGKHLENRAFRPGRSKSRGVPPLGKRITVGIEGKDIQAKKAMQGTSTMGGSTPSKL